MFPQLWKVCESFLSKAVEYMSSNALTNLKDIMYFKPQLETLQKNLKSLCDKAFDVDEEIKNAELSGRKKRKRVVEEWLEEVKSVEEEVGELVSGVESKGFITRLTNGGTSTNLNEKVEKLIEQSQNFGELLLDVCGIRGESFLTNGLVGEAFQENLERILKLLEARQVSSIGVYGMGGVGKTTLAKHIHNRLLQQSQGRVFWVTVSQEFTITSLQDKIARVLGVDLLDEDEEDKRASRLHRALSQMKNSVLILDDVWENMDMLKVGCPFSVEYCRMIITTRSLEVCHHIRCQEVIPVQTLRKDEAWKLFIVTLGKEIQLEPGVEEIAKSMAKMCDGLPLGIITVAGSMRGVTSIHTWTNGFDELKECVVGQDEMGDDVVYKVLKYSFDRLNRSPKSHTHEFNTFQLCLLYCSLYPEDEELLREDLVRKLISEGLVDEKKNLRAQIHKGHSILDKLVNVCLLESCVAYLDFKCVKMHDLVRGMALKIAEGKYMVRAGDKSLKEITDEEEWTKDLEMVSLMNSHITSIGDGISPNCPKLSSLLLCKTPLEAIPDSFFSRLHELCILDLCETRIRMLPNSICDLKSLKALLLERCEKLEYVPYLGKLKALRELNLSSTAIKEVPQGVEELLNLRFLSLDAPELKMLPSGLLLKLGHLQYVSVPLHLQVPIEEFANLKQVELFNGGVKNVNDFNCFIASLASNTCYGIGVGLPHCGHMRYVGYGFSNKLILGECNLQDAKVSARGVADLTITNCEGISICFVDDLSRLDNPTSLKYLRIESCGGIEYMSRSEQGIPTLGRFELLRLDDLKAVIHKGQTQAFTTAPAKPLFSSLTSLEISWCNKMSKVGLPVLGVPNLEDIYVRECGEVEQIFEHDERGLASLSKLRGLWLDGLPRLRKVGLPILGVPNIEHIHILACGELEEIFEDGERGSLVLPKLQELRFFALSRLKSVCKSTIICNSIERIKVRRCPRLKKLPVHVGDTPPPSLELIKVEREWWGSLEWDNLNLPLLLHSFIEFED